MKLRFSALASGILLASSLHAQSDPPPRTPPTAAEMVSRHVGRLTTLLSLESSQETSATAIFSAEQNTLSSLRADMKTARTALKTAIEANDSAGINNAATQIGALTTRETVARATADAAFYALLTGDQKTKFAELSDRHFGGPGPGFGPGGPRN